MSWAIVGGSVIAGGMSLLSGLIQSSAAQKAAETQSAAAQTGIEEQQRQFDAAQEQMQPYTAAGQQALGAQGDLSGLGGAAAQQAAIAGIAGSPEMAAMTAQGENAMLQNAAATGGLRGGNLQGAMAQFRPQLLSQLINQQYQRLGGLSQMGAGAASGMASAGMQHGVNVSDLLAQQGAAQAGGQLAKGQAWDALPNAVMTGLGMYGGLGGFGKRQQPAASVESPYVQPSSWSQYGGDARYGGGAPMGVL